MRAASPRERGVTMVLVAVAMVAIIAMAALSIDVISLYLVKEEAQRCRRCCCPGGRSRDFDLWHYRRSQQLDCILAADLWRTRSALRRKLR